MNSKYNPDALNALEHELIESISNKPISEIDLELQKKGVTNDNYVKTTRLVINEQVKRARKQLLLDAREQINIKRERGIVTKLIDSVDDAQAFLFEAVRSGTLQKSEFTAAFREGEDIPDNDLINLANQIKELMDSNEK